jgi:lysophospholipase L1-like esterase
MTRKRPVLFIGDSVTDAGRRDDESGHLGDGYVRIIAEHIPGREVINLGIGGDRVIDLRQRWQEDVIDQNPEVLSVYVGINDTWRRYDSDDPTSAASFESDYRGMLEQAVDELSPQLVLIEPFVLPVTEGQKRWHEDLDEKRAIVGHLAADFGAAFVPLQLLLNAAAKQHGAGALAEDGVHPTALGHRMIADAWLAAAQLD